MGPRSRIVLLVSSVLLTAMTAGAGVFTVVLGCVHVGIPRIVGYRAALDGGDVPGAIALPTIGRGRWTYRLRRDDLIGITWVMSNAASYVLVTIGILDLAWAAGWRGVPVVLGATWIAGWWAIRAIGQLALGRRQGDLIVAAWFAALAVVHLVLALSPG